MICLQDNKRAQQLVAQTSSVHPNSIKKTFFKKSNKSNIFCESQSHFLLWGPVPATLP